MECSSWRCGLWRRGRKVPAPPSGTAIPAPGHVAHLPGGVRAGCRTRRGPGAPGRQTGEHAARCPSRRPDHVYLSDFGLSKSGRSGQLTGTGEFLGTPDYTAPEQIEGTAADGRTDQYALACSAFELLTGTTPFAGGEGWATVWAHLNTPPPASPHGGRIFLRSRTRYSPGPWPRRRRTGTEAAGNSAMHCVTRSALPPIMLPHPDQPLPSPGLGHPSSVAPRSPAARP